MNTEGTRSISIGDVIELVAEALADFVDRPPGDLLHLQRIRTQDPACGGDEALDGDGPVGDALLLAQLVELDIHAHQIATLARDDQKATLVGRMDRRLEADVRESR